MNDPVSKVAKGLVEPVTGSGPAKRTRGEDGEAGLAGMALSEEVVAVVEEVSIAEGEAGLVGD